MFKIDLFVANEVEMEKLGGVFSQKISAGNIIFLQGSLGMGKTTFVRGLLRGLGYQGVVRSPTYALVESYGLNQFIIHHFDFYRFQNPEEQEYLGLDHYFTEESVCIIEWPENALTLLPKSTLCCKISPLEKEGRFLQFSANSIKGEQALKYISQQFFMGETAK